MHRADMFREVVDEEVMEMEDNKTKDVGTVGRMVTSPGSAPRTLMEDGTHVDVEEETEAAEMVEEEEETSEEEEDITQWKQEEKQEDSNRDQLEVREQLEIREQLEVREQEHKHSRVFNQLHLSKEEGWSRGMCEQD